MRGIILRLTCLLLLWSLTHCDAVPKLVVAGSNTALTLTCTVKDTAIKIRFPDGNTLKSSPLVLDYKDDLSGEYSCTSEDGKTVYEKVYVKLRSCDDCIDLNPKALASISIADVVATALIGWAVYLIMTRAGRAGAHTSDKKSSDKKRLIPNRNRSDADDTYQPLRPHEADVYNVLGANRR